MHRAIFVAFVGVWTAALAEEPPSSAAPAEAVPTEAWAPSTIALVQGSLSSLTGGGIALEQRVGKRASLIVAIAANYSTSSFPAGTMSFTSKTLSAAVTPGLRWYLGATALSGPFVGVRLPFSVQFQSSQPPSSSSTGLQIGLAPNTGVSLRFERLVVQLSFGLDFAVRVPLSGTTPVATIGLGAVSFGFGSGINVGLDGSIAFGYAF